MSKRKPHNIKARIEQSLKIAPNGMYLASQLTEAIEQYNTQVRDSCNPQHLVAHGWIAILSSVSLDEAQAAKYLPPPAPGTR